MEDLFNSAVTNTFIISLCIGIFVGIFKLYLEYFIPKLKDCIFYRDVFLPTFPIITGALFYFIFKSFIILSLPYWVIAGFLSGTSYRVAKAYAYKNEKIAKLLTSTTSGDSNPTIKIK